MAPASSFNPPDLIASALLWEFWRPVMLFKLWQEEPHNWAYPPHTALLSLLLWMSQWVANQSTTLPTSLSRPPSTICQHIFSNSGQFLILSERPPWHLHLVWAEGDSFPYNLVVLNFTTQQQVHQDKAHGSHMPVAVHVCTYVGLKRAKPVQVLRSPCDCDPQNTYAARSLACRGKLCQAKNYSFRSILRTWSNREEVILPPETPEGSTIHQWVQHLNPPEEKALRD